MNELVTDIRETNPTNVKRQQSAFSSIQAFEDAQRMSKALAESTLIPPIYRNNLPNIIIALEMAQRINQSPFLIMQEMQIINGKPSMSSKFVIAILNTCGLFSKIRFIYNESKTECFARAKDLETGEILDGPTITMQMAKDEGWLEKQGSKWKTMPELMLAYRAGQYFGRLYAPEYVSGITSAEEAHDMPEDVSVGNADLEAALNETETVERVDG